MSLLLSFLSESMFLFFLFFAAILLILMCIGLNRKRKLFSILENIPGPPSRWPLIGNLDLFWDKNKGLNYTIKERLTALAVLYDKERIFKLYIGQQPVVYLFKPETVQAVLANNAVIDKSHEYEMVEPWLGKGLGTRNGNDWRTRRKMLTPAFHFNILKDFIPIINEQSVIFAQKLGEKGDDEDVSKLSISCALDIICETAMGVKLGSQNDTNNEYAKALHRFTEIFVVRILSPWLWPDLLFRFTSLGKEMKAQIKILHEFTRNVIKNRKSEVIREREKDSQDNDNNNNNNNAETKESNRASGLVADNGLKSKKRKTRLAFLDLLLTMHLEGGLTEEEVREEVDMFTFAGHDTTGIAVAFALYCIGLYPEVQEKIHLELDSLFGDDKERPITAEDLRQLNYLECVIKEALRLYPSGPFFARKLLEDVTTNGYIIPKGSVVWLCIMSLHLNEEVFPEPARFDPDRFSPAQSRGRHPYAYSPFSGGPRGCIGQRFAMMEEKIILANVLRRFNLKAMDTPDKLVLCSEIILRPKSAIRVTFSPREETRQ